MAIMTNVDVLDIEDGILDALRDDPTLLGWLKTIQSYGGELEEEIAHVPHLYPAAYVLYRHGRYAPITPHEEEAAFTFSILVVTLTLTGNQVARRGRSGVPGNYAILREIRRVLIGNMLGIPLLPPLQVVSEEAVINTRAMSIYDAQYVTRQNVIRREGYHAI